MCVFVLPSAAVGATIEDDAKKNLVKRNRSCEAHAKQHPAGTAIHMFDERYELQANEQRRESAWLERRSRYANNTSNAIDVDDGYPGSIQRIQLLPLRTQGYIL